MVAVGVGLLSLEIQRSCQTSRQASVLAKEGRFEAQSAPAPQTLIVWSVMPPLTILEPSGENWTEEMEPIMPEVCAFCFSAIIVRDSAAVVFSTGLVSEGKLGLAVKA